jgi:hypothetical protein
MYILMRRIIMHGGLGVILMHTKPFRALADAAKSNIFVRVGILALVAAIIAWQLFPPWLKLSVVFSAGAPVLFGLAAGAAVGWLWLSWRLFAITAAAVGGLALVVLAAWSGLAGCALGQVGAKFNSAVGYSARLRGDEAHTELWDAMRQLAEIKRDQSCERFIAVATGKRN